MVNGISALLGTYIGISVTALLLEVLYRLFPRVWESVAGWMDGEKKNGQKV